jgi:hypothetical protein
MILDIHEALATSQAVTASAVGENVKDLSTDRSIGNGEPMCIMFNIETDAVQSGGDEDYTFDVEYATNEAQTTGRQLIGRRVFESGTPTAPAQNADLLVAGFAFAIPIPLTVLSESERYLGIRFTTAGAAADVTVSAYLMPQRMVDLGQVSYPNGYTFTHD